MPPQAKPRPIAKPPFEKACQHPGSESTTCFTLANKHPNLSAARRYWPLAQVKPGASEQALFVRSEHSDHEIFGQKVARAKLPNQFFRIFDWLMRLRPRHPRPKVLVRLIGRVRQECTVAHVVRAQHEANAIVTFGGEQIAHRPSLHPRCDRTNLLLNFSSSELIVEGSFNHAAECTADSVALLAGVTLQ